MQTHWHLAFENTQHATLLRFAIVLTGASTRAHNTRFFGRRRRHYTAAAMLDAVG